MFKFFESISGFITTIVNFVVSLFEMVINLLRMIYKSVLFLFAIIPNLPGFVLSFVTVIVAMAILLQILNKGD